jgi:hypothetical protein
MKEKATYAELIEFIVGIIFWGLAVKFIIY